MNSPPVGSTVSIEQGFDGKSILIPPAKRSFSDISSTLFLVFWLCGWAAGEYFVSLALLKNGLSGTGWFFAAWLGGWTVGGVMAMRALYDKVQGPRPEIIVLGDQILTHQKGKKQTYERTGIGKVTLERTEGAHLLYFDYGADRVFVGENLKEPEREWLHQVILQWRG